MPIYRQGDVLLKSVDKIPDKAKLVDCSKDGRVILSFGTATGHAHAFALDSVSLFQTPDGERFLSVNDGAELVHDEHATITPQAGNYQVVQQREYSPEEIRNVQD